MTESILEPGSLVFIHAAGDDAPVSGTIQIGHLDFEFVNALG